MRSLRHSKSLWIHCQVVLAIEELMKYTTRWGELTAFLIILIACSVNPKRILSCALSCIDALISCTHSHECLLVRGDETTWGVLVSNCEGWMDLPLQKMHVWYVSESTLSVDWYIVFYAMHESCRMIDQRADKNSPSKHFVEWRWRVLNFEKITSYNLWELPCSISPGGRLLFIN